MNSPTQLLMDEHDIIMQTQHAISLMDNLWKIDEEKYKLYTSELLHFFSEYSDKFHHHKEEEVLFPSMNEHPEFILQEIIGELEEHHELFRDYAKKIRTALENENYPEVQQVLNKYINDLLDHIAVENDELFSMAESLFSEDELEKIYFRFKDIDLELGEMEKLKLVQIPAGIILALKN